MNYMYSHLKPATLWPDPLFVTINLQVQAESYIKFKQALVEVSVLLVYNTSNNIYRAGKMKIKPITKRIKSLSLF